MTTTNEKSGAIYGALLAIAAEMPSIAKEGRNAAQGYSFRGVDQVFNSLQPIFSKHGVIITVEILELRRDERPSKSGGVMAFVTIRARYNFVAKDGSSISTESAGEGCDTSDKATPKALSIALKYALLETFLVPTADSKDPENDSHELAPMPDKPKAQPKPAPLTPATEPITSDQKLVIAKLLDDKKRNMEDTESIIEKVCGYYKIKNFPVDLTSTQASTVIAKWSKKAAK